MVGYCGQPDHPLDPAMAAHPYGWAVTAKRVGVMAAPGMGTPKEGKRRHRPSMLQSLCLHTTHGPITLLAWILAALLADDQPECGREQHACLSCRSLLTLWVSAAYNGGKHLCRSVLPGGACARASTPDGSTCMGLGTSCHTHSAVLGLGLGLGLAVFETYSAVFQSYSAVFESYSAVFQSCSAVFESYSAVFQSCSAVFESYSAVFQSYSAVLESYSTVFHFPVVPCRMRVIFRRIPVVPRGRGCPIPPSSSRAPW